MSAINILVFFGLPYQRSRLLPLWSHIEFPAGQDSKLFHTWKDSGLATAGQLFHNTKNRYKTLHEIAGEFGISESFLQYMKVNSFV